MGVRLPAEYQEVTCIIGQGAQYIDTGYVLNSECRVQGQYGVYGIGNVMALFGARDSNYNNVFAMFNVAPPARPRIDYGKTITTHSFDYVAINNRSVVDFDLNAGIATVNGRTYAFADSLKPFTCPSTALIFAAHTGNTVDTRCPRGEIVYLKITDENGIVVRDMVPCYRKADNKPGMYDLVSKTFYTNQGTGEFLVGPDVVDRISPLLMTRRRALMARVESGGRLPAEYQEVEYLGSTGTQYINTGIVGRDSIYAESRLMFTQTDFGNAGFLGSRQGSGDQRFYLISAWQGDWHLGIGRDFFSTTAVLPNTLYDIKVGRDWNTYRFALNVNGADILSGSSSMQTTYDMYVFAVNNCGTASRFCSARLYLLKISNDNSLLRDYIPCYRKSDNKPGMYDLVSNTFFTNAGTGEFVVGANVN